MIVVTHKNQFSCVWKMAQLLQYCWYFFLVSSPHSSVSGPPDKSFLGFLWLATHFCHEWFSMNLPCTYLSRVSLNLCKPLAIKISLVRLDLCPLFPHKSPPKKPRLFHFELGSSQLPAMFFHSGPTQKTEHSFHVSRLNTQEFKYLPAKIIHTAWNIRIWIYTFMTAEKRKL